jgi:hypothetical protein
VPDDKLERLMAELQAIELWDRIQGESIPRNEFGCAGSVLARRIRRLEIIGEINVLLNKVDRASDRARYGVRLST